MFEWCGGDGENGALCVCVLCAAAAEATKEFNLKAINQYYALA